MSEQPTGASLATALAVLVQRVESEGRAQSEDRAELREDFKQLRESVERASQDKVSRGEWGQRNEHVDSRLQGLGREIGELRTALAAKTAPWWSVGAVLVAGASLAWSVFGK